MSVQELKSAVRSYWNAKPCGTEYIKAERHSLDYFEKIEDHRYTIEPEIFAFAQFTRFRGKKVLEVGTGAGSDFLQWARAGAQCYGIDLTEQAIEDVKARLALYDLKAEEVRVADAEQLPYQDNFFDLVYSWGVIHHSPDMVKCLQEIIRVTRPGGRIKLMVYNRRSLFALYRYLMEGLFKGKPFQRLRSVIFFHQESMGTKAFRAKEIRKMIAHYPVKLIQLSAAATNHDLLYYKSWPLRALAYIVACLWGWHRCGWFMTIELKKVSE